jgi:uncharacterized SAM-binding protein YcdF (DUF218 family)
MYFYLSKTLGIFAFPSNFILFVVICGVLLWATRYARLGRPIAIIGIVLMLIAGMSPLGTALLLPLENRFPQWSAAAGAPDGIVVLGGIVRGHVTLMRKQISFGPAADRLLAAVDLHRQYPAARIVFSGGNSNLIFKGMPESELAERFLEDYGVPSDDIVVDRTSRNTIENAANAKEIAAPKPGERWLLVTSAAHMPRAIGLFRAAGFRVEAYPVDWLTGGWGDAMQLRLSLLGGFVRLDIAAHEWEGLFIDWLMGRTSALFPGPGDAPASG